MILNEEQLAVEPVLLRTSDLLDTIVDLKRQLREANATALSAVKNGVFVISERDTYVQEKVAEAVLAESEEWYKQTTDTMIPGEFIVWAVKRILANRRAAQHPSGEAPKKA